MSAERIVRVSVELPAGPALSGGLADAMRDLVIDGDGTIRLDDPHPLRKGPVVGTWAVMDGPLIP